MTDPSKPELQEEPPQLKFLRRLVTTLTVVMIGGLVLVISLLVIRLSADGPSLPESITLPDGVTAEAVTFGTGWVAVVTQDQRILILDPETSAVRQEIELK
ncbi:MULTISPECIES: DUF6476 family protein [Rhodobacterales]|jgi:hypothetical protein|uniref:DUF6476 family protein n=1 Tax=Rhodobacterales TaxID=204455 RepID=UPI00237F14ED|nr:DUF6476 family protein [Phaeobacter gallaeciensis]MDE4097748.1 DUF6476 family protein [Phaeobacter gallaeciensis]MDE4106414.1 DUF6476 family protein [Phaeobacter gallaeciensis]MDE4111012.1 DUF6476 family protein [Phaeobacter gallaeciensis]MDE4115339.1 DUF6476 family protein [Phaeobacter gallaeciensis]MDE4119809.1 DUF6476 family protein [Phaeobacter gallaeciensis]